MNETVEEVKVVEAPPRKCQIGLVLGKTLDELLQAAPENAIARAHALSRLKQEIPASCVTYEQIKEWIETTIELKSAAPLPPSGRGRRNQNIALAIEVDASETVVGRCSFSESRSGSTNYDFTEEFILQEVEEAVESEATLQDVLERLEEEIRGNVSVDMESNDDTTHDDYDVTDSNNYETNWNSSRLESRLIDWLRNNHPDKLEALQANQ